MTELNKCIFCEKDIELCQIEGLKTCKNPICYFCLEKYWKFNKGHGVTIEDLTTK